MGRLGSGPRVMGRLGSNVWVNTSFQIFVLTAGRKCPRWGWKLSGGEMSSGTSLSYTRCISPSVPLWVRHAKWFDSNKDQNVPQWSLSLSHYNLVNIRGQGQRSRSRTRKCRNCFSSGPATGLLKSVGSFSSDFGHFSEDWSSQ